MERLSADGMKRRRRDAARDDVYIGARDTRRPRSWPPRSRCCQAAARRTTPRRPRQSPLLPPPPRTWRPSSPSPCDRRELHDTPAAQVRCDGRVRPTSSCRRLSSSRPSVSYRRSSSRFPCRALRGLLAWSNAEDSTTRCRAHLLARPRGDTKARVNGGRAVLCYAIAATARRAVGRGAPGTAGMLRGRSFVSC